MCLISPALIFVGVPQKYLHMIYFDLRWGEGGGGRGEGVGRGEKGEWERRGVGEWPINRIGRPASFLSSQYRKAESKISYTQTNTHAQCTLHSER